MSQLAKRGGAHGKWSKAGITIWLGAYEVTTAVESQGLFYLQADIPPTTFDRPFVGLVDLDDDVWSWHRRLRHLGLQNMINLLAISTGIPLTKKGIQAKILAGEVCPVCMVTRALTNIPRDPASRREGVFGALFHVDT